MLRGGASPLGFWFWGGARFDDDGHGCFLWHFLFLTEKLSEAFLPARFYVEDGLVSFVSILFTSP
jgi:hypothetical protein